MDMKEYIVREDRGKLLLYTLLHLCLTILLMLLTIYVYGTGHFLLAFFGITGLWFSVKAMCRYGFRLVKNTPVCEFKRDEVILPCGENPSQQQLCQALFLRRSCNAPLRLAICRSGVSLSEKEAE